MTVILNRSTDVSALELRAVLEGRSTRFAVGTALTLLAGQRPADIADDLEDVIRDRTCPGSLRAQAVRLLARARPPSLTGILVAALAEPETAVLREAVRAIGRLGDPSALAPLQRAGTCSDPRLAQEVALAALTLAARHGVRGVRFANWSCDEPIELDETCGELAIIRRARRDVVRAALTVFQDDPLDVFFLADQTQIINAQDLDWLFLPVRGAAAQLSLKSETPVLLGLLAEWDPSDDEWFEGFLLFVDPSNGRGTRRRIALIDTASEIVMTGFIQRRSEKWHLELATTSPTMLQAKLNGDVQDESVQFQKMLSRSVLPGRKRANVLDVTSDL